MNIVKINTFFFIETSNSWQEVFGIFCPAILPYLKMQVRAGGCPGAANPADDISLHNRISGVHLLGRKVGINTLEAVFMLDDDVIAKNIVVSGDGDHARLTGKDLGAFWCRKVNALVLVLPTGYGTLPLAIVGGENAVVQRHPQVRV